MTAATTTPSPESVDAGAVWRVVIIDDSPDDRAEVRRLLSMASDRRFQFTEAETGAAGVRAVLGHEAGLPDCVVLDYHLPDLDAPAVLAALATLDLVPVCPVVVLTGGSALDVGRAVLRAGAQDFLNKGSMTPEQLSRAVENAIERWAMAHDLRERAGTLRRSAARDAYRLALADALRPLADPKAVQAAAVEVLGRQMRANRVVYAEVELNGALVVEPGYTDGASDISGRYQLDDLGSILRPEHGAGRSVVAADIMSDPAYSDAERERYRRIGVVANLGVPLLKAGRLVSILSVHQSVPRQWTAEDVSLVEETAQHTWSAVQRARAEVATRESEARLRLALEASDTGLWTWDLGTDAVTWSAECHHIHGVPEGAFAGTGAAFFQLVHPDDRAHVEATVRAAIADGRLYECEFRVVRPSGEVVWVENRGRAQDVDAGAPRMLGTITDITDRKRSEERLRRNAESFHQLIQNNPFGVYVVDADFRLHEVSLGAKKAFASANPLFGRDFADVIRIIWPEPFASEVIARFRHTLATGEPYNAASTVERRRDIQEVEAYDWRIEQVVLPDGRAGVVCYFYDLSERQHWEAALSARERELQSLADNSPDVLTRFDRDLRHVFVNAAVERATGRPRSDFIGKTNRELGMPAALCDQWEAAIRLVFATGAHESLEFGFDSPDDRRYYHARLVPEVAADGTVEFVLGVTHDVTDRRRADAEVLAAEERLRMALAAAQAGAWAWDVPTGAVAWSPENYSLYGYDPNLVPLGFARWEERIHLDDRTRVNAAVADCLAGRTPEFRCEFRVLNPTRGARWLLGIGRVELTAAGEPVRMIGINLDITDRKRTEQALAEQDVRKDEFLATLAHELRNPLAPIRSGVAVLRMTREPEQTARALAMIDRQLGHMVNLVDDLLDVSRVRSGKIVLRTERVTIREAIDAAVEACRPSIDSKRHTIEVTLPAEPLAVDADKTRLVQMVTNLLTNAAKYTEPGGRIDVAVERDGAHGVIRVSDNGIGIAPEALPTLWDMFTQVRDTLDKAQGGLGIGLSLVKKLVELHGGSVEVESSGLGKGSSFTVRLPLGVGAAPDASPVSSKASDGEVLPIVRRVLVVDDNVDGAELLAMLLSISGHTTRVAHTGPDALAEARDFDPEVVFLDIGLPGMDGYEVARRLRADPATAGAQLVAVTGWGAEGDKRRSKAAGFDLHLTKPVEATAVHDVLDRLASAPGDTRPAADASRDGGSPWRR